MKTKPLLMLILNVKCLIFSFIFFLLFNIQHSTLNIAFAQPLKKDADKPKTAALPSMIKTINIPWPVSAAVDEKENRIFVMSVAGENSAVFVINGRDNSIIKKVRVMEGFNNNAAGNGIAYNENTKRLYAVLHTQKSVNMIVVVDANSYKILSLIKNPRENERLTLHNQPSSVNLSKRHNMFYAVAETNPYGYIFVFNGGSNKFVEEVALDRRGFFSEISGDGDFLYIVAREFMKFDIKTKKFIASLPISSYSVPFIDEKNGLIFVGSAYKLYVIDLKTFKLKDEREDIPVSSIISGISIALNPATNHLFVPTYNDSISVIDVPSMKMIATIKVGQTVKSIAVNSRTNRVYVTLVNEENKVVVIQDR